MPWNSRYFPTSMKHLDPEVRVRVGDSLYDLTATPVATGAQRDAILGMRGYDPVPEGILLFRFTPR